MCSLRAQPGGFAAYPVDIMADLLESGNHAVVG